MFKVVYGIHRGTLTSRDSTDPREFETEEEARAYGEQIAKSFNRADGTDSIGCHLWFLKMYRPDGTTVALRPGNGNYR